MASDFSRRESRQVEHIGHREVPRIIMDFSTRDRITAANLFGVGYNYSTSLDKWNISDASCDFIYTGKNLLDFEIPGTLGVIVDHTEWEKVKDKERYYPLITAGNYSSDWLIPHMHFILAEPGDLNLDFLNLLNTDLHAVLVLETENAHAMPELRAGCFRMINEGCKVPVVFRRSYTDLSNDAFQLYSATDLGGLLLDGLGDGIWLRAEGIPIRDVNSTAFGILQATRTRISRTEYISCPSCGRTLFDLQETTAKIRKRTDHLKGIKIGIMGCIVNGPGEMADADYGYVGTGPGKITLYKEKEVVKRNVAAENAVDELIELIKQYGDWVEPAPLT